MLNQNSLHATVEDLSSTRVAYATLPCYNVSLPTLENRILNHGFSKESTN